MLMTLQWKVTSLRLNLIYLTHGMAIGHNLLQDVSLFQLPMDNLSLPQLENSADTSLEQFS